MGKLGNGRRSRNRTLVEQGCRPKAWIEVKELIAPCAAIIRKYGYLSKTEAEKLEYKIDKRLCTTGERVLKPPSFNKSPSYKRRTVEISRKTGISEKKLIFHLATRNLQTITFIILLPLTQQEYIE